jgi:hypothetical protein
VRFSMCDWDWWVLKFYIYSCGTMKGQALIPVICLIGIGAGQKHTQRTVAIAVGGLAAFGFVIVFLLFLKSVMKKKGGQRGG